MFQARCSSIRSTISSWFQPFNEETQCTITLLNQSLGLETDKYITKPLMSLLFVLSTCPVECEESILSIQTSCLKFDELLVENIHSQLMDFHKTKNFIFQSYLLKMFLSFNEENLELPKMVLTKEMNKY